jgi:uncharacterized membrane protein YfcA
MMEHVLRALGVVLLVCIGVRVAAWLINPVLPALVFLFLVLVVAYVFFVRPSIRDRFKS